MPTILNGMCVRVKIEGSYPPNYGISMRLDPRAEYNVYFIEPFTEHIMLYHNFPNEPESILLNSYTGIKFG